MRIKEIQNKVLVYSGVLLVILIPTVFNFIGDVIPIEYILAFLVAGVTYLMEITISSKEDVELELKELGRQIEGTGLEIFSRKQLSHVKDRVLKNNGDLWFFNMPLGRIRTEEGFKAIVKTSLENSSTKNMTFLLSDSVKDVWNKDVNPKLKALKTNKQVVVKWLPDQKDIGFMLLKGSKEAFLLAWDEPFVIKTPQGCQTMMMFHVTDLELYTKLEEMFEKYLLSSAD